MSSRRQARPRAGSVRTVVTLNDGRTAGFDIVAADPQSDIAVVRARHLSGSYPDLHRLLSRTYASVSR